MRWLNEPNQWSAESVPLSLHTEPKTDFWRKTHYGFVRDNGHFFFNELEGDFDIETEFRGDYRSLYDQAGIMVRADETNWLKTGIEFLDGIQHVSAVVTRDFSDWSVVPLRANPESTRIRLERRSGAIMIFFASQDHGWTMFRTAHLSEAPKLLAGPMAASPEGNGFSVVFDRLEMESRPR
ncbi:MAG: DUF1349 domain-containing protein [Verrucomicrobia bacterium]|nr:DUF1349 domain-containing protein [Verrucomicrobiota bacterium]MBV9672991.1 DUF1349 domain-containing protein [Verrucomicrobiota bacterium]